MNYLRAARYYSLAKTLPKHSNEALSIGISSFYDKKASTSLLVNEFLRLMVDGNNLKTRQIIDMMKSRAVKGDEKKTNEYFSCFNIYLSRLLLTKDSLRVHDIKSLIDSYDLKKDHKYDNEIKEKLMTCLIYSLINIKGNSMKEAVSGYIKKYINEWNFNEASLKNITDPQVLEIINKLSSTKCKEVNSSDALSITRYLEDGVLSFNNLCSYIQLRFTKYDRSDSSGQKLYCLYESLDSKERDIFLKEYYDFNRQKQLKIESHCMSLSIPMDKQSSKGASLGKMESKYAQLLGIWHTKSAEALEKMLQYLKNSEKLSPDEALMKKYMFHLTSFPHETLISLVISGLLSNTLSSQDGYCRVIRLVKMVDGSFRGHLNTTKYNDLKIAIQEFFHEEDVIVFWSILIKICLQNCYLECSKPYFKHYKWTENLMEPNELKYWNSNINSKVPAFIWDRVAEDKSSKFKRRGVVKVHPFLVYEMKNQVSIINAKSILLPMLSPPNPWISPENGGFLKNLKPMLTSEDSNLALEYFKRAHHSGQLDSTFKALTSLGSTAWAINGDVLDVLNIAISTKKEFLKIPDDLGKLDCSKIPPRPNSNDYEDQNEYKKALYQFYQNLIAFKKEFYAIRSLRTSIEQIQAIANSFSKNGDIFFLPHNIDFRGRAYPMTSVLNHHQDDMVRGLMMFWFGKPLGKTGFNWLKYQLAGVSGNENLDANERIAFVERNYDLILDSARDPLNGKMWWKSADKPWQTLALCFEFLKIENHKAKGNPVSDYVCRLPIHQDGSCNGMQHYAALGADEEGAKSVNVIPSGNDCRKQDIYTKVLEIVRQRVLDDISSHEIRIRDLASSALPLLSRKVVKQTVMTSVYGVTLHGAIDQISEKIKDIIRNFYIRYHANEETDFDINQIHQIEASRMAISTYIARHVFASLSTLFSGAKKIQDWLLKNCHRVIKSHDMDTIQYIQNTMHKEYDFFDSKSYKPMMWTSLSGIPIVQMYRHHEKKAVKTPLQQLIIHNKSKYSNIDIRKQTNGIAPNFIHSIDSIHLLMVAMECANKITFAAVHDSFWTLPSDVDELSRILREQFLVLHTSGIMNSLRDDMIYSCRNSYQLVYVSKKHDPVFHEALNNLRLKKYNKIPHNKVQLNDILLKELKASTEGNKEVQKIVDEYRPLLFYNTKQMLGKSLIVYDFNVSNDKDADVSKRDLTPLLVPVKILELPSTGKLNIEQVLNSKYFFS